MMAGPVYIEGLDQVLKGFGKAKKTIRLAAFRGLQKWALDVLVDAINNLRQNASVVTGLLRQSGKVQRVAENTLDAGFFDSQNDKSGYAYFVEYGRRAGKMPPPDELAQWAYKKFRLHDRKLARQAGWAMAVKIAKAGTKPHPYFMPAIDKNKSRITQVIQDEINRATR